MPLVNIGRDAIAASLIVDAVNAITAYDNANAYIGVGDSTAAYAATQTDLQAATNFIRRGMEATYPIRTANSIDFRSLYGLADANFPWEEWGIFNAAAAGQMLCRIVSNNLTKDNTQSWEFTATVVINVGA